MPETFVEPFSKRIYVFFFVLFSRLKGNAALLLANLEKEKELLRIFLRVSQMENAVLRRMNLNSFLMVSGRVRSSRGCLVFTTRTVSASAGARPTRDQVPVAVGPAVQSDARTPSGSPANAQRGPAQDTATPGAHQLGERVGTDRFASLPPPPGVPLLIANRVRSRASVRSWPKTLAPRNCGGRSTRSTANGRTTTTWRTSNCAR